MYSEFNQKISDDLRESQFLQALDMTKGKLDKLNAIYHIQYSPKSNSIILYKLIIPKGQRNSGIGTKFIQILIQVADNYEKNVTLTPSDVFGSNLRRLIKFYLRFGFQKNPHPRLSEKYVRYPFTLDNP